MSDQQTSATQAPPRPQPAPPRADRMPPWKVLLHNDDDNDMAYVVETIVLLRLMDRRSAILRMLEAHTKGCALLLVTHREHAELVQEQLASRRLVATIEPE